MGKQTARANLTIPGAIAMILAAAGASAQQAPQPDKPVLGEIIVTAQKRAERPWQTSRCRFPSSRAKRSSGSKSTISRISSRWCRASASIRTRAAFRASRCAASTPAASPRRSASTSTTCPSARAAASRTRAILSGDFDTFDMARIEVLRGPQGTLYGASSLGGVIKYVTNEPTTDGFEASPRRSAGRRRGRRYGLGGHAASSTSPSATPSPFARAASTAPTRASSTRSATTRSRAHEPAVNIVDGPRRRRSQRAETCGGRLSALFQPSDDFSLNLTAFFQDIAATTRTFEADPVTLQPLYDGLVASSYHPEYTDTDYRIYSATIDWDFGPVSLQSVTSYGEFEQLFRRMSAALTWASAWTSS